MSTFRTFTPAELGASENDGRMGIRYYAYAFDAELTQQAIDDPYSILSSDPLADAWGLEPHAAVSVATFEQTVPHRDMLYLDKAWSRLQSLTRPRDGCTGAAYRMFEGNVEMHGLGWDPWVRTLRPDEIPAIRDDLAAISDTVEWDAKYVRSFLESARAFVDQLAADGRGMVYMIG